MRPEFFSSSEWAKAATQPLGLCGFALALVIYLAITSMKNKVKIDWLVPAAYCLAAFSALGGVAVEFARLHAKAKPFVSQQWIKPVQRSTGSGSPNIQGVQGPVTITEDFSSGKTKIDRVPQQESNTKNALRQKTATPNK